jgi:Delta14-sterol reductase
MSSPLSPLDPGGLATAAVIFFGFIAALFAGSRFLPGERARGAPLPGGGQETYTLNGFRLFLVVVAATAALLLLRPSALAHVHAVFWPLFAVANVSAFAFSIYLATTGDRTVKRRPGALGFVLDCFYGVELNPRVRGVDLKLFSYRPSLMGLGLLNVSFAAAQYQELGYVTTRMWVYQVFYFVYLCNYFQFEHGMIFTWDIIAERFGWMLVWGDYVLVPFFYSLPAWYLVHDTEPMPAWQIGALAALYAVGFVLFRGSNEQKHQFKADPTRPIWGRPPETIGGRLLVSGFWGIGRKLNYTGELCLYLAWSLTTGAQSVVPYLLPLWLMVLFPHRAWRDDQRCRAKYGEQWEAYCRRARFRMIPFLY